MKQKTAAEIELEKALAGVEAVGAVKAHDAPAPAGPHPAVAAYQKKLNAFTAAATTHTANGPLHADHDQQYGVLSAEHRALTHEGASLRKQGVDAPAVHDFHGQHAAMLGTHLDTLARDLAGRSTFNSEHHQAAASVGAAADALHRAHQSMAAAPTHMDRFRSALGATPDYQTHLEHAADHLRLARVKTSLGDRALSKMTGSPVSAASAAAIPRQNGRLFSLAAQMGPRGKASDIDRIRKRTGVAPAPVASPVTETPADTTAVPVPPPANELPAKKKAASKKASAAAAPAAPEKTPDAKPEATQEATQEAKPEVKPGSAHSSSGSLPVAAAIADASPTQSGKPRQRAAKGTALAAKKMGSDHIQPHGLLDAFWNMHEGHSQAHAGIGSAMSHRKVSGDANHPEAYHMVSRAERKDGGVEEQHLHGLTANSLSVTHRIKKAGDDDFAESTAVLPRSKRALNAHLATL